MKNNKIKLSKSQFCEAIKAIQNYNCEIQAFNDALKPFNQSYCIFNVGEGLESDFVNMIEDLMNIPKDDDILSWWLYEDVEKKIYFDKDDDSKFIDVSSPEILYDYLYDMEC